MGGPQSPALVENTVIAQLAAQDQKAHSYVDSFPQGADSAAKAQWIGGLDQVAWGYQQFGQVADWLQRQGLPQAGQRLSATLTNLSQARNMYIEMYASTLQAENVRAGIWRQAVQFGSAQISQANDYQNAVANNWVQDMFDINENRCYGCHRIIGAPGGGYCHDCARNRGWVL
jgi:hypothetical protein